ncbi:esterase/lipase [Talaromyces proteolyticus]|uniref:Esterase/lipase n=1 Tax=Talaromyces proteolyticus TaxID=1131652 RepID=A0AAD4KR95_9EURO|nr:esterase/lipase [Talaromyces proteolyticus]KAH8697519.1 esterase/lipase [Talaromyces proteolyticus]
MPLQYDPEFAKAAGAGLVRYMAAPKPALHDIEARRARFKGALKKDAQYPIPDGITRLIHHVTTSDGHRVAIYHFRKTDQDGLGHHPAIVHIHGGGYFSFSATHSTETLIEYVSKSGVQMLSIEYRLAPENPFPIPLDDCWTALTWIHSHAESLNIDPNRIAVMGESAGGGLAANLVLRARDRSLSPPLAKQFLIYPMLDDRTQLDTTEGLAFFTAEDCITGWTAYLGKEVVGAEVVPPYAVAARNANVEGLPELYIDCPQLDILLPENLEHVKKYVDAKIPTEFHLYKGVPHGFISLAPTASISKRAIDNRVLAMSNF